MNGYRGNERCQLNTVKQIIHAQYFTNVFNLQNTSLVGHLSCLFLCGANNANAPICQAMCVWGGMTLWRPLFKGCCTVYVHILYTIQRSHRFTWKLKTKFTEMIVTLNSCTVRMNCFHFFYWSINITAYKEIQLFAIRSIGFLSLVVCFKLKTQAVIIVLLIRKCKSI